MATNPVNPFSQAEIDKANRYLTRYNTGNLTSAADQATYNQIKNTYGGFSQNGLVGYDTLGDKQKIQYRTANPYSDTTKGVDMKYLDNITNMQKNNQGVSQAQMNQYNDLAKKWNYQTYDPNREALNKAAAPIDAGQYKTQATTIDDLAKKYGFDYSKEYATRQAEAEAQAQRNAIADAQRKNQTNKDENLKSIDNNLMNMADSLDRNYFQQYMQQAQNQTNSGLNGGIASDQNLRMAMARQADMGSAYRDANLGRMQENNRFTNDDLRLAEGLGLVNQQALARADSLYNDRLNQAFGQTMQLNQFNQAENQMQLDAAFRNQANAINNAQYQNNFDYQKGRDNVSDTQWNKQFAQQVAEANRAAAQWESSQKWGRQMDLAGLTGMYDGKATFDREKWLADLKMQQARLALDRSGSTASGGVTVAPSATSGGMTLDQWLQKYQEAMLNQQKTPLDKYYTTPAVQAMEGAKMQDPSLNRIIGAPLPPALNGNLSPWEKMKMLFG